MESFSQNLRQDEHFSDDKPSNKMLFLAFFRLGLTAFGGPAMVAYIKELSVNRRKWLDEKTFSDGVTLCQSIPGATAMQTAAYVGLTANGFKGGLSAYAGFALPAFMLMLMLSIAYTKSYDIPPVISLFSGLQVLVVAILTNATYSFGGDIIRRRDYRMILIALISAALLWLSVSPFIVILGAALAGGILLKDNSFVTSYSNKEASRQWLFKHIAILFSIIIVGLALLYFTDKKLFSLALLMLKIDLFAFGGAFGSIPLMLHEIVYVRGWLDGKTLMDGIALGQVTPGPIVITATFVGYLMYGFTGAVVATIAIFTPSFVILSSVMPFYGRIKDSAFFLRASRAILATFVGLLFYATLKFASVVPWDALRVFIFLGASVALFKKIDILYVVLICSVISVFIF